MRVRAPIAALAAAAVLAGGAVAACSPAGAGQGPLNAAGHPGAAATGTQPGSGPAGTAQAGTGQAGTAQAGTGQSGATQPGGAAAGPSPAPAAGPVLEASGAPAGVKAQGAILADASTGQVLWAKDPDTERPMASVTKVMTALLVLQSGDLNRPIQVPKAAVSYAWKYGGETAALLPGDVLTAQHLLNALLLASGADAAYTLANAYGPGLTGFVARMNATATAMGLAHTHFTSPDGLPYPTETSTYSTPADLLALGAAAMKYPAFAAIVSQRFDNLPQGPGHHKYWWTNTNRLIGSYPGATGIKDGYTDDAGHCLLFEAVRNGRTLIGVVLDSPPSGVAAGAQDAARMLNWGFALQPAPAASLVAPK
jgi:D-alanyl-D-alanine carboxypeptidase (penicillin-binding protein 5/6)